MAARYGHAKVVQCLLRDPRVDLAARDNQAIIEAAEHGEDDDDYAVFDALLRDARVDPSARHNEALARARYHGCRRVTERLLADVLVSSADQGDNGAGQAAAVKNHHSVGVVKRLLRDGRARVGAFIASCIRSRRHSDSAAC